MNVVPDNQRKITCQLAKFDVDGNYLLYLLFIERHVRVSMVNSFTNDPFLLIIFRILMML